MNKILIALLITAIFGFVLLRDVTPVSANPSSIGVSTNATSTTNSLSTTTAETKYMNSTTGTSTIEFDPQNSDIAQFSAWIYSTSTPIRVHYGLEFSNNNIDWYPFQEIASGNPAEPTSGARHDLWNWLAATTTADEKVAITHVLSSSYAAKYGRLVYETSGGSGEVHIEIAVKKQF